MKADPNVTEDEINGAFHIGDQDMNGWLDHGEYMNLYALG